MSDNTAVTIHKPGPGKQSNKPFKSKFASKGSIKRKNKGRISKKSSLKQNATAGQEHLNREQRRNRANQMRKKKKDAILQQKRIGREGVPKIVAILPLGENTDIYQIREKLFRDQSNCENARLPPSYVPHTYKLDHFKQRITVFEVMRETRAVLDAAKVADILLFVVNAEDGVDERGKLFLSLLRAQGFCSSIVVVQGLENIGKRKHDVKKNLTKWFHEEIPDEPHVVPFDASDNDVKQLSRWISEQSIKEIHWREKRPYMIVEKYEFIPGNTSNSASNVQQFNEGLMSSFSQENKTGTLVVRGYLRGKAITPNQLVHLVNYGTYQLSKIQYEEDPCPLNKKRAFDGEHHMNIELFPDPEKQESLQSSLPPDTSLNEQTWPTAEDFNQQINPKKIKKVPKGFSEYQSAWIIDSDNEDEEDEDVNEEDEEMNGEHGDEEQYEFNDIASEAQTHVEKHFNIDDDEAMTEEERAAEREYILKKIQESNEDMEFPDEVVTPMDIPARVRFQKYRGLKSFRQSPWDPKENLPVDYSRVFQFENFQRSQKLAMLDPSEYGDEEYAEKETYLSFHIKDVPENLLKIHEANASSPLIMFGLLRHEQKCSVLHFQIKKNPEYEEPIKSKDELIVQIGFRTFKCNPIYSEHNPRNDKHKFERFLQPNRFLAASMFLPITFKPSPILMFKKNTNPKDKYDKLKLVATGSLLGVDPDRIMLKKIILTGYPFKIHKKQSVVRYMFHNPEDIRWFKPVEIYTKQGRHGVIKESLGTHGYMKCLFDDVVHQSDTVCMNLYKRVFPKWTTEHLSLLYSAPDNASTANDTNEYMKDDS